MNPNNCIVTIKRLTGDASNKVYTTAYSGIRAMILGIEEKALALYDMPLGLGYSFIIFNQVDTIEPADKFEVTDPMSSGLTVGDVLVVQGAAQKVPAMSAMVTQGVCLKI